MRKNKENYLKDIGLTVLGGLGLFIATIFLNAFVSSPPTRAEFDALKAKNSRHLKNIDDKLSTLKQGQNKIIDYLLQKRGK